MDLRNPKCFDFLTGQHGNYQTMKSPLKLIAYCKKEDKEPLVIGTLPETSSKKAVSNEVAGMVNQGASLVDVNAVAPGFLLLNFNKINVYMEWARREREKKEKLPWTLLATTADMNQCELAIVRWLNKNIKQERVLKQCQMLIQGPHNYRKSSLVQELEKYLTIMYMPTLEDFFDSWQEDLYDLVVFDEWTYQQHNPQFINQFLDGSIMNVRIKGGQKMKKQNVPVMILTNQSQEEAFWKGVSPVMRDTFLARVHWVLLDRALPIEEMIPTIPSGSTTGTIIPNGNLPMTTLINTTTPIIAHPLQCYQNLSDDDDLGDFSFNFSDEEFQ